MAEEVLAAPSEVRDFYVDLNNIKAVHPLVVGVESISHGRSPRRRLHPDVPGAGSPAPWAGEARHRVYGDHPRPLGCRSRR